MWDFVGQAYQLDVAIFYFININLQNSILNVIMPLITNFGLYLFWIVICILIAVFGGQKGRNVALLLIIGLILGHLASEVLKYIVMRPRPFTVLQGVHQLGSLQSYSFPSGHATEVFVACILLGKKYGYMALFLLIAFLVSFSRVYMGMHYPSDVIGGALIGLAVAMVVLHYEDNILKLKNRLIHR